VSDCLRVCGAALSHSTQSDLCKEIVTVFFSYLLYELPIGECVGVSVGVFTAVGWREYDVEDKDVHPSFLEMRFLGVYVCMCACVVCVCVSACVCVCVCV